MFYNLSISAEKRIVISYFLNDCFNHNKYVCVKIQFKFIGMFWITLEKKIAASKDIEFIEYAVNKFEADYFPIMSTINKTNIKV